MAYSLESGVSKKCQRCKVLSADLSCGWVQRSCEDCVPSPDGTTRVMQCFYFDQLYLCQLHHLQQGILWRNNIKVQVSNSCKVARLHCKEILNSLQVSNYISNSLLNLRQNLLALIHFFYKNIVFPAQAENSYFSADFRLKILLWIFLDYSLWHLRFRMSVLGYQLQVFGV